MARIKFLRGMDPRRRFLATLVVVYALSLPVISIITYVMLRDFAVRNAYSTGSLYLSAMEEIRHYVGSELRPLMYEELPGRFLVEAMSRSYISGTIARNVNENYPGYRYRNAVITTPKNPRNRADPFESRIINRFISDPSPGEWRGIREMAGGRYVVIARAGEPFSGDCMRCHGDPSDAPPEMLKRYGGEAGFGMKEGQLADAKFVYIPIEPALAEAKKNVTMFIAIYTVFFSIIFLIINHRFRGLYGTIESDSKMMESINTGLTELNKDLETMVAERTVISLTCRRLLRDEEERVTGRLREGIETVIGEAGKLEEIVRNFEALLRTRKSLFRHEDVNGIINSALPLIRQEADDKGVALEVALATGPLRINTQKNLLRTALMHTVRNAIEAAPPGGRVSITTGVDESDVAITISDTGPGIPADNLERIFEPFYSTKALRFGIGLPLVRQIVSEHLGRIEVKSKPEKGTSFKLIFPVRWKAEHAEAR
jgi:signal transduction histidine kinase